MSDHSAGPASLANSAKPMFWRLWVSLLLVASIGCLLVAAAVVMREAEIATAAASERMAVVGNAFVPLIREQVEKGDFGAAKRLMQQLAAGSPVIRKVALVFEERQIAVYPSEPIASKAPTWFARWLALSPKAFETEVFPGHANAGRLELKPTASLYETASWRRFQTLVAALGTLILALSAFGAWRLRRELAPLRDMTDAVQRFKLFGGPPELLAVRGSRELRALATVLNSAGLRLREAHLARMATEVQLREQTQRTQGILAAMRDCLIVTDHEGAIRRLNPAAERLLGTFDSEATGKHLSRVMPGLALSDTIIDASMRGEEIERRVLTIGVDGGNRHYEMSALRTPTRPLAEIVWVLADRTVEIRQREALLLRADHDPLTGLLNRSGFGAALHARRSSAAGSSATTAVCLLDLDHFARVNELYGRRSGDEALKLIGQRLVEECADGTDIACLGGDEFALAFPTARDPGDAMSRVRRLLDVVCDPLRVGKATLSVTASAGVTTFPADAAEGDQLLRHAELAMFRAKQSGRNLAVMFDHEFEYLEQQRRALRQRFEQAIEAAELRLHFQPKVDMRRGQVLGFEALVRWQHPEHGLIAPSQFLPAIESTDAVIALDCWVLDRAIAQRAIWQSQNRDWTVAINVSARHFAQPEFASILSQTLNRYPDVEAASVELEVVESAALSDIDAAAATIARCKELGVKFSLDDFGVGYASLSYLRRLPADAIKIDQSFVADMLDDAGDRALIEGIVSLARAFGRVVIAEGVELPEQGALLMRLGCDAAQGYGIARPMPASEATTWANTWRPQPIWRCWAHRSWDLEDLPLLAAANDHHKWVDQVLVVLDGGELELTMSELRDVRCCRFGQWYFGRGRHQYGAESAATGETVQAFAEIEAVHSSVHDLGAQVVSAQQAGNLALASAAAGVLLLERDRIVSSLQRLHSTLA